jgi:hypothetical protein
MLCSMVDMVVAHPCTVTEMVAMATTVVAVTMVVVAGFHAKSAARRVMPPCAATNGSRPTTMVKRRLRGIHWLQCQHRVIRRH